MRERLDFQSAEDESLFVQEKARQIAEAKIVEIKKEILRLQKLYRKEGKGFAELVKLRESLEKPLDFHIGSADYQEAFNYVEGLQNVPNYRLLKKMVSDAKLLILGFKMYDRLYKQDREKENL
ncbi:MAG: hypothetical protein WC794_03800 [Candidatus Doudnabacteria bacterium]|jgi:hypothetical protein